MSLAVDSMWLIEENPADTLDDVRAQERLYAGLREQLSRRYGRLADLTTANRFGLKIESNLWGPLVGFAMGRALATTAHLQGILDQADALAAAWRFFHWELEFPEAFFDRRGQPLGDAGGFAAVLGNPPYVRQEGLGEFKKYLAQAFPEVLERRGGHLRVLLPARPGDAADRRAHVADRDQQVDARRLRRTAAHLVRRTTRRRADRRLRARAHLRGRRRLPVHPPAPPVRG